MTLRAKPLRRPVSETTASPGAPQPARAAAAPEARPAKAKPSADRTERADGSRRFVMAGAERIAPDGVVRIPARTGAGFLLRRGEKLRVIDPEGEQVADLMAFDAADTRAWLSSGRTIDYANRIYPRTGDILYSNRSDPMLEIVEDTSGGHDFLLTPCCREMFSKLYGIDEPRPSCYDNLRINLEPFGIEGDRIPTTLNVFMNVRPDGETGELTIGTPTSKPGDSTTFLAHRDLIVGLTACSAEKSNNGTFKPIDFEILSDRR
jgi:uncharacterized protein YcgI (DUF1989 family)